jgi:hypothetical protein
MKFVTRALVLIGLALSLAGCQFYSVSDSAGSGKGYITHNWACWRDGKKARFTDLKTGREVRFMSSRVEPIPADEALAEVAAADAAHR